MSKFKQVIPVQDDGDWYVIPIELKEEFDGFVEFFWSDMEEDDYHSMLNRFHEKFGEYAVNGCLSQIQFYIKE